MRRRMIRALIGSSPVASGSPGAFLVARSRLIQTCTRESRSVKARVSFPTSSSRSVIRLNRLGSGFRPNTFPQ